MGVRIRSLSVHFLYTNVRYRSPAAQERAQSHVRASSLGAGTRTCDIARSCTHCVHEQASARARRAVPLARVRVRATSLDLHCDVVLVRGREFLGEPIFPRREKRPVQKKPVFRRGEQSRNVNTRRIGHPSARNAIPCGIYTARDPRGRKRPGSCSWALKSPDARNRSTAASYLSS